MDMAVLQSKLRILKENLKDLGDRPEKDIKKRED